MKFKKYLSENSKIVEGFFNNIFTIPKSEAEKLSFYYGKNWNKGQNSWTLHNGENHLFTYNIKTNELLTDIPKQELSKIINL